MKTTIRQLIWLLALLLIATAAQAQTDLAVNQAFQKYGSQKGCKMVTLIDGQLKGYDLKVYKSLSFRKYGKEIMALVKADRPKAKKIREIVEDGQVRADEYADFAEIKATLDKIALSVSNLQLWVDEQIAAGNLKKPEK